jgi:hypothetical protein
VAFAGILTVSTIAPLPAALKPDAPPVPVAVQVALAIPLGSGSDTAAPDTLPGPAFVTTTVYTTVSPGMYVADPSVLVTCKSAEPVSVSVAVLFAGLLSAVPAGAVTVAVVVSGRLALGEIVATTVYVTDPPGGTVTGSLAIAPLPLPSTTDAPLAGTADHVALEIPDGSGNDTVAAVAVLGPLFVTTSMYVDVPPGVYVVFPSVFVIARSTTLACVSVSVALLFPGTGSGVPVVPIPAVLARLPLKPGGTWIVITQLADAVTPRPALSAHVTVPDAFAHPLAVFPL